MRPTLRGKKICFERAITMTNEAVGNLDTESIARARAPRPSSFRGALPRLLGRQPQRVLQRVLPQILQLLWVENAEDP